MRSDDFVEESDSTPGNVDHRIIVVARGMRGAVARTRGKIEEKSIVRYGWFAMTAWAEIWCQPHEREDFRLVAGEHNRGRREVQGRYEIERFREKGVQGSVAHAAARGVVGERGKPGGALLGAPVRAEFFAHGERRAFLCYVDTVAFARVVEKLTGVEEIVLSEEWAFTAGGALDGRGDAVAVARQPRNHVRSARKGKNP